MPPFRRIGDIGDVYMPTQFREIVADDASWKLFIRSELGQLNRIFTHLRRGGVAILSGDWGQVTEVMDYMDRKKEELIRPFHEHGRERKRANRDRARRKSYSGLADASPTQKGTDPLSRLMCWADAAGTLQVSPPPDLPYLLEWVGENQGANEGRPFLVPVTKIQKIERSLAEAYPIRAFDTPLLASENVLPPHSQETVELFQRGLESV